jgi:hypothetical protein
VGPPAPAAARRCPHDPTWRSSVVLDADNAFGGAWRGGVEATIRPAVGRQALMSLRLTGTRRQLRIRLSET